MVTDYSHLADGSMWPTSGLSGGKAANDAMTADGSEPAEPLEPVPGAPDVTAEATDARHTEDGGTGRPGARWASTRPAAPVAVMRLACPMDGTWEVRFDNAEIWTGPDGKPQEFVAGRCGRCGTRVLVEPSVRAIELAKARLGAAGAMRKVAGDGRRADP